MSQNNFVGREHEKERLVAFLNNDEGGSALVAGRRGSGKTTLLKTVLNSRERHGKLFNKYTRWTMNKTIQVHIPLIIVNKSQADTEQRNQAEIYRSLILRSIVFALLTHINKRQYSKFVFSTKLFLSIGIVKKIKELEKYVEYLNLQRQFKTALGVGYKKIDINKENGYVGSIDLSDSKIEMLLYDLFQSFAHEVEFVFVFDEMDKLEGTVDIQEVVLYLKNLFSDTGVHAIFVCNENQGFEVLKYKDSSDDNKYATLFRETIIIKGIDPIDLKEFLAKRLTVDDQHKLLAATAGVGIVTDNYPIRVNSILHKNDNNLDRLLEDISEIIGDSADGYKTAGRLFVNFVYAKYKKKHNLDYNHLLYKILCEVSDIIVGQQSKYFNANELSTILYTTDLFNGDKEREKQYKLDPSTAARQGYTPNAIPELVTNIETTKHRYNRAIGDIITLYERANWLNISTVPGANSLIILEVFNGDSFNVKNVNLDFETVYSLNKAELEIQKAAQKYIGAFRAFSPKNNYWSDRVPPFTPFEGFGGDEATKVDLSSINNTKLSWKMVKPEIEAAEKYLLKSFFEKLNLGSDLLQLEISETSATFVFNDNKVKLVFEFLDDKISKDNTYDKTIILRTPTISNPKLHSSKIKYFEFQDWENSVDSTLTEIKSYIVNL